MQAWWYQSGYHFAAMSDFHPFGLKSVLATIFPLTSGTSIFSRTSVFGLSAANTGAATAAVSTVAAIRRRIMEVSSLGFRSHYRWGNEL